MQKSYQHFELPITLLSCLERARQEINTSKNPVVCSQSIRLSCLLTRRRISRIPRKINHLHGGNLYERQLTAVANLPQKQQLEQVPRWHLRFSAERTPL